MDLRTYLSHQDIPVADFAARLGISFQSVHRYMAGLRTPQRDIMLRILKETNGRVRPDDFFMPHPDRPSSP